MDLIWLIAFLFRLNTDDAHWFQRTIKFFIGLYANQNLVGHWQAETTFLYHCRWQDRINHTLYIRGVNIVAGDRMPVVEYRQTTAGSQKPEVKK